MPFKHSAPWSERSPCNGYGLWPIWMSYCKKFLLSNNSSKWAIAIGPSGLGLGFSSGCFSTPCLARKAPPSEAAFSSSSGHLKYVAEGCEDHPLCSHRWGVWHDNVLLHCIAVMNSTVYYAKNPMTVWHGKLSSSPRQGNETKSTDQLTIQDVLPRLKAKKVLSKSAR